MFNIKNTYKRIKHFDKVTRFRLINAFLVAIGMNLFWPIAMDLKGEYLAAWAISTFMILETLMVKTNRWVVNNFSLGVIYRTSAVFHLILLCTVSIYFWSPFVMILLSSVMSILEVTIFSAYSIKLNNYLTEHFPKDMNEFQIIRNSTWADGMLIGLSAVTLIVFIWSIKIGILFFLCFNLIFTFWLLWNWNFFKNIKEYDLK